MIRIYLIKKKRKIFFFFLIIQIESQFNILSIKLIERSTDSHVSYRIKFLIKISIEKYRLLLKQMKNKFIHYMVFMIKHHYNHFLLYLFDLYMQFFLIDYKQCKYINKEYFKK